MLNLSARSISAFLLFTACGRGLHATSRQDERVARAAAEEPGKPGAAEAAQAEGANVVAPPASANADALSLMIQGVAAVDRGLRGGPSGGGHALASLSSNQINYFNAGKTAFAEIDSVTGQTVGEEGKGLGPGFNARGCGECHAYPALGGSSPLVNPQLAAGKAHGANNIIPFFITNRGPVREVRFKYAVNPDGTLSTKRDGGVHDVFSIAGRTDAGACDLPQPDFIAASRANNLSFRIPTPVYGAGLVESISDSTILKSHDQTATMRQLWGISGHANSSDNDGTITRFGWKAQNKSLAIFAGEAYNVEQGVTNELFPNERVSNRPACVINAIPEDHTNYDDGSPYTSPSDVVRFAAYMRMLAPPVPAPMTASAVRGAQIFNQIACSLCHTPSMPVASAAIPAQTSQQSAHLYSDLMVHHMGAALADDIVQGAAGPDEFRSAPLWGLGQRAFFLHDGRTSDLVQAIVLHSSRASAAFPASEANLTVQTFLGLPRQSQQDLINFLRSL